MPNGGTTKNAKQLKSSKTTALNEFRRKGTNSYLQSYLNAKRTFESTCRRKEMNFQNKLNVNIRDKKHCPNALWNVIRGSRETSGVSKNIYDNTWYIYFDNLLVNEDFKSQIYEVITNHNYYCINC